MKIGLLQMEVLEKNKTANLEHGLQLLDEVVKKCDIVALPEIWTTGYSLGHLRREAEVPGGELFVRIQRLAVGGNCAVIAGSVPLKHDGKIYNSSVSIGSDGSVVHVYDKVHLFGMYHENLFFSPGRDFDSYFLDGLSVGTTICYDLRFPELYRRMALQGAKIVFVVAEWPEARGSVWRLLLQARAAENHMFVVGVNAVGTNKTQKFYGHSMVCAPDGSIVAEAGSSEEVLYVDIDLSRVDTVRNMLNALTDVRKELVKI